MLIFMWNLFLLELHHAKKPQRDAIEYGSRFHQIIVYMYILCFCFNNSSKNQ